MLTGRRMDYPNCDPNCARRCVGIADCPQRERGSLKVLQVNDYRVAGGCEVVMKTTVSLLQSNGIDVEVFTSEDVPAAGRTPLGYIDSPTYRRAFAAVIERFPACCFNIEIKR